MSAVRVIRNVCAWAAGAFTVVLMVGFLGAPEWAAMLGFLVTANGCLDETRYLDETHHHD